MFNLPLDKANHYFYGSIVASAGACVGFALTHDPLWAARGTLAAVAVGIGKEVYDAYVNHKQTGKWLGNPRGVPHGVEGLDALATSAPAVFISAPLLLIHLFK